MVKIYVNGLLPTRVKVRFFQSVETPSSGFEARGQNAVFKGQSALSPMVAKVVLEEMRKPAPVEPFNLTDREIEVLEQLALGISVKEIK
jgi:hypothetical protein